MRLGIFAVGLALLGSAAVAQTARDPQTPEEEAARDAAYDAIPDTEGSGPYKATFEIDPSLPDHVVYHPKDLSKLGSKKLAILGWGNGGCRADGARARLHLAEIASHGYIVVAPGGIHSGPRSTGPLAPRPLDPVTGKKPPNATTYQDVTAGIDWAIAENARKGSPYYGRIDTNAVAVSGTSCGGLQALQVAGDKRIKAVVIHNSGIFSDDRTPVPGINPDKSLLKTLHTPVLYILGGPNDVAWPNGTDDFAKINHVPAALIDGDVGHGGTFRVAPNGGEAAQFAVNWLEWQLRGDKQAAKMFMGKDCTLCSDPKWKIERKGF